MLGKALGIEDLGSYSQQGKGKVLWAVWWRDPQRRRERRERGGQEKKEERKMGREVSSSE